MLLEQAMFMVQINLINLIIQLKTNVLFVFFYFLVWVEHKSTQFSQTRSGLVWVMSL